MTRWHCAQTHPNQEYRAELALMEIGFTAYLPLHLEPGYGHAAAQIVPLFRGYLLVQFDPARDQWRRIYRCRGISSLIGVSTDRPTPLPPGVVEALQARTSSRRIVDDPGADPPVAASERPHWQNFSGLSAKERGEMLLRQFGRQEEAL